MAARKKSTKKKTSSSGPGWRDRFAEHDWAQTRRKMVTGGWSLIVIGGLVGAAIGAPALKSYAARDIAATTDAAHIAVEFVDLPADIFGGEIEAQLETIVLARVSLDPFERDALLAAKADLEAAGWCTAVHQIERVRPDLVRVHADFVTPLTVIRDQGGDHLIDRRGMLLPWRYEHDGHPDAIPIVGVAARRPARAGEVWPGGDVAGAIRLVELIYRRNWWRRVESVDASAYRSTGMLSFTTVDGPRFFWGSPPGTEGAGEARTEDKLTCLDDFFASRSGLAAVDGQLIDLSIPVVTGR